MSRHSATDIVLLLILVTLAIILKIPVIDYPFTEDGATWTINSALWIYDNHIVYPLIKDVRRGVAGGSGHPTLIFNLLAFLYHIFGYSIEITHIVMLVFGCITLIYTYLFALYAYNRYVGMVASCLLLFTPLFFSLIGQLRLDVPLMAFSVMTAYYVLKEREWCFALVGSLLVLTKEPGTFVVFICFLYLLIKYIRKEPLKRLIFRLLPYCIPAVVFVLWMILYRSFSGSFLYPNVIFIAEIPTLRLQQVFIWNFRWFLSLIIIISALRFGFMSGVYPRRLKYAFVIGILAFIVFSRGEAVNDAIGIFSNLIFSLITGLVSTLDYKRIDIKYILAPMILVIYISLHGFVLDLLPRYMLPMIPFYLVVASSAIYSLSAHWKYLPVIVSVIAGMFFIYHIEHSRYKWTNMSYTELIDIRYKMLSYIEDRYPDAKVGMDSYFVPIMLTEPRIGYVSSRGTFGNPRNIKPGKEDKSPNFDVLLSIVEKEDGGFPLSNAPEIIPKIERYYNLIKEFPGRSFVGRVFIPKNRAIP